MWSAKLNQEKNAQILVDDWACDKRRDEGFWVSNLADCRNRAIHKHGKYRESGHVGRKMVFILNIFIVVFISTCQWRYQISFGSKDRIRHRFKIIGSFGLYVLIRKILCMRLSKCHIEKAELLDAVKDMIQAEILPRFLGVNNIKKFGL